MSSTIPRSSQLTCLLLMPSGVLEAGTYALCANKGRKERIGRLLMMHANNREDIKVARTGDIIAVAGLKDVITGETLCDEKRPIMLERMEFPGALTCTPVRLPLSSLQSHGIPANLQGRLSGLLSSAPVSGMAG